MKNSKLKWIIIAIVVIIIAVIGTLAVLYFTTDLFRSNQELFFKYISQNNEILGLLQKDTNEQNADNLLKQSKYTTDATVNFQLTSNDAQIANQAIPPRNFSIKYAGKTDGLNQKASSETIIKFLTKDLFTVKYIRDNDVYGIKSDEVTLQYVAVENNNLKEFMKKLSDDTEDFPNKIESMDFSELLTSTSEEQKIMLEKMMNTITTKIGKDKYTKKKNVTIAINNKETIANEYAITLTMQELKEILKMTLDSFAQDDAILTMITNKFALVSSEITKEDVKELLQNMNIADGSETIRIAVYEKEGKLVKTAFTVSNGNKMVIDIMNNKVLISFGYSYIDDTKEEENTTDENEGFDEIMDPNAPNNTTGNSNTITNKVKGTQLKSIEITRNTVDTQSEREYIFTIQNGDEVIKIAIQNKMNNNLANGTKENNMIINFDFSNITYFTIKVASKDTLVNDIVIEEFTKDNSRVLNNYKKEAIANLMTGISNRLGELFIKKIEAITAAQLEENRTNGENASTGTQNLLNTGITSDEPLNKAQEGKNTFIKQQQAEREELNRLGNLLRNVKQ